MQREVTLNTDFCLSKPFCSENVVFFNIVYIFLSGCILIHTAIKKGIVITTLLKQQIENFVLVLLLFLSMQQNKLQLFSSVAFQLCLHEHCSLSRTLMEFPGLGHLLWKEAHILKAWTHSQHCPGVPT